MKGSRETDTAMINYFDYTQVLRQSSIWNAPRVLDDWSNNYLSRENLDRSSWVVVSI